MSAQSIQNQLKNLEDLGFVAQGDGTYHWRVADQAQNVEELPWHIAEWVLGFSDKGLEQRSFSLVLSKKHFLANLQKQVRAHFPSCRRVEVQADTKQGFWILFEFLDKELDHDQSRLIEDEHTPPEQLPHGLAGLHISVMQAMGQFSAFLTKQFFLGNTPGSLFLEIPKLLKTALFGTDLSEKAHHNLYICTSELSQISLRLFELHNIPSDWQLLGETDSVDLGHSRTVLEDLTEAWVVLWNPQDEPTGLHVPPIEILEQKEVSKRFQQLDEALLLEDYQEAYEICRQFMQKYPHSLYLIRRLAFLSLHLGSDLERSILEQMAKSDPQSLLTHSLWVARREQGEDSDTLLENLSKLGNRLQQEIVEFEGLEITSLTLPEMLGDAWSYKDVERAMACYERVLQTRGEIPRILVKLIRLMREEGDSQSEESYMDRLLACEVPVRTRAAIYYRLAEIKESSNLQEAASWALKSWQTHRLQARYALLTAHLLIKLARGHEAIHVLVETAERLQDSSDLSSRFELELEIAKVWLDHLQRHDLAMERIERARELIGEEWQWLPQLLLLVERLDEPTYHADLALQLLQAAVKAEDHGYLHQAVERLIAVAELIKDKEKQALIYGQILTYSLLDVEQIVGIVGRSELSLPYDRIIEAMEQQVSLIGESDRGRYYLVMGDVAKQYMSETDRAVQYYEKALYFGCMSPAAFDLLDQTYARKGHIKQRFTLLKKRYELAPANEQKVILRELYYFDEGVSDEEKDAFAIQIYQIDPEDVGPLEERITVYEQSSDVTAIMQITEKLVDLGGEVGPLMSLLLHALHSIQSVTSPLRYESLAELLVRIQEIHPDPQEHARHALEVLWPDPQKMYVKPYLEYVVGLGEIPSYDFDEMFRLLSDDSPKLQLLMSMWHRRHHLEAQMLETALRLSRELRQPFVHRLPLLLEWAHHHTLSPEHWSDYRQHWLALDSSPHALRILALQWPRAQSEAEHRSFDDLFQQTMAQGVWDKEEFGSFFQMLPKLPEEWSDRIKLRWLDYVGFDAGLHTRDWAFHVLRDIRNWEHRVGIVRLLEQLCHYWEAAPAAQSIVHTILKIMMKEQREGDLSLLLPEIREIGLLDGETSVPLLMHYIALGIREHISTYWFLVLAKVLPAKRLGQVLQEAWRAFETYHRTELFFDLAHEAVDQHKVYQIRAESLRELKIIYGDHLLRYKKDLRRAQNFLEQAYTSDRGDVRTWCPLIYIYQEMAADTDLYELLYRVLPFLRESPGLLLPYRLELNELDRDLRELGQRLGLRSEQTEVSIVSTASQHAIFGGATKPRELSIGPSGTQISNIGSAPEFGAPQSSDTKTTLIDPNLGFTAHSWEHFEIEPREAVPPVPPSTAPTVSLDSLEEEKQLDERTHVSTESSLPPPPPTSIAFSLSELGMDDAGIATETRRSVPPAEARRSIPPTHLPQFALDLGPDFGAKGGTAIALPPENDDNSVDREERYEESIVPPAPPLDAFASPATDDSSYLMPPLVEDTDDVPAETSASSSPEFSPAVEEDEVPMVENADEDERLPPVQLFEIDEWRIVAHQGRPQAGFVEWLVAQNLSDKTEQHVALQVTALCGDQLDLLSAWGHKVWRYPQETFYELRWADRMGRDLFHPVLKSPLARLLKTLHPLISNQFMSSMNIHGIAERLRIRSDEILRTRKLVDWKDEVVLRTMLGFYVKYLSESGFQIYHVAKLEDRFFFDMEKRDIYIDRDYYLRAPATHLFHRIIFLLRAVSLDYYPLLHLSPSNDIFPFLMKCRRSLEQNKLDNVRRMLGMEKDPVKALLSQSDREHLEAMFVEVGSLSPDKVTKLVGVYVDQIYRINLAETLDVIGVCEAISNTNLFAPGVHPQTIIQSSQALKSLIAFTADLKFNQKTHQNPEK